MKLAFALFKYFPYGGLQRDCVKIAMECVARGHQVDVYTLHADADLPDGIGLHLVAARHHRRYRRYELFAASVQQLVREQGYDGLVGFNKMPGLDVYYAADPCYAAKAAQRGWLYRQLGRTRSFLASEQAVFAATAATHSLLISPREMEVFRTYYATAPQRLHLLPPGIQRDRLAAADYPQRRAAKRQELGLGADELMLLMVGSGFKTKGLDRSLRAIAALPQALRERCRLYVVGQDNIAPFARLAARLGLQKQFYFLAGRDDVADLLFAADVLLHPAYRENTGTVLLEALAAQLPLLVTAVCGYSFHIRDSGGGVVLDEPFSQQQMNSTLERMLSGARRHWQQAAAAYVAEHDLFSLAPRAVDIIEQVVT